MNRFKNFWTGYLCVVTFLSISVYFIISESENYLVIGFLMNTLVIALVHHLAYRSIVRVNSFQYLKIGKQLEKGDEFCRVINSKRKWIPIEKDDIGDIVNYLTPPVRRKKER